MSDGRGWNVDLLGSFAVARRLLSCWLATPVATSSSTGTPAEGDSASEPVGTLSMGVVTFVRPDWGLGKTGAVSGTTDPEACAALGAAGSPVPV